MKGVKQYRLVLVEWVDSHGCAVNWADMDGVKPVLTTCHSVGYLVAETDDALVVVPHVAFGPQLVSEGQGCGDMTIPRVSVRKVHDLFVVSEAEARELTEALRDVANGDTTPLSEIKRELYERDDLSN